MPHENITKLHHQHIFLGILENAHAYISLAFCCVYIVPLICNTAIFLAIWTENTLNSIFFLDILSVFSGPLHILDTTYVDYPLV